MPLTFWTVSAVSCIDQCILDAVVCAEMLPSLDNFLSYGADVFKARPDYRQNVLDIYEGAMTNKNLGDSDKINACKLAESVLLNLAGHVDDVRYDLVRPTQCIDIPFSLEAPPKYHQNRHRPHRRR